VADATEWGRVAEDGTVYVRTADGERAVGSWHAGDAEAGLAHFARRYDDLATEVALLETRLSSGAGNPVHTQQTLTKLRESLDTAAVVGDVEGLRSRIDTALGHAKEKQVAAQAAKAAADAAVLDQRRALAEEAERVAQSSEWKASGDRLRGIVEEWKALPMGPKSAKPAETELWHRISVSRRTFDKRRDAHFAALEAQREQSRERKEALIREAEPLSESAEWNATTARYKELMSAWKSAGRAARGVDDELWDRFKAAQDAFFSRRAEHFATKDAETAAAVAEREALLAEAESLEPERDLAGARARLADITERWEKAAQEAEAEAATKREWLAQAESSMR